MRAEARAAVLGLLISGLVPALTMLAAPAAALDWVGDQTIGGVQSYSGEVIVLTGNLVITGTLSFSGVDLTVACPANGSYTIEVRSGGRFNVQSGSKIHSLTPAYRFCFIVRSGGTLNFDQSTLRDCGYAAGTQERKGLALQSGAATVTASTVRDGCNGVVVMGQSSPTVSGSTITGNEQSGVWIESGSSPLVDGNVISGNQKAVGNAGSASAGVFGTACSPTVTYNIIRANQDLASRAYGTGIRITSPADTCYPVIQKNDISGHNDSSSWGLYLDNCDATVSGNNITQNSNGAYIGRGSSVVDDNRFDQNFAQTVPITGYSIRDGGHSYYNQNSIAHSAFGVYLADYSLSQFSDGGISYCDITGIGGDASTTAFSTTFTNFTLNNNAADVLFDSATTPSAGGTVFLVNTTHDPAKVIVTDTDAYVKVSWNMRVRVSVETGDVPSAQAKVKVFDRKGAEVFTYLTDAQGLTPWWVLEQKTQSHRDNITKTPYNVTGEKAPLANWTSVNLVSSRTVDLILDDTWPSVSVETPANGTVVNRTTANLTGTASPRSEVYVNNIAASMLGGGAWSATVNLLKEGPNPFRVRANDGGRNEAVQDLTLVRDTIAPVIRLSTPDDLLLTNRTPITFSGNISETGGETTINGEPVEVNTDGSFSVEVDLFEGENTLVLESRDAVFNTASVVRTLTLDSILPEVGVSDPPTNLTITNATIAVITGYIEFNASLTMNGQFVRVNESSWTVSVGLLEGENLFLFVARDKAGNERPVTIRIVRDTTPPTIFVVSPKDNSLQNTSKVEIRGIAEEGAIVKVNGELAQMAGADFKALVTLDKQGRNTVRIESWDMLNNRAEMMMYVNLDTERPALSVSSPLNNFLTKEKNVEIRGRTEKGLQLLTINERAVMVDGNGVFTTTVTLGQEGPNLFEILARDGAGNVAQLVLTILRDTELVHTVSAPKEGAVLKTATVLVIGTAEANGSVSVNGKPITLRPDKTFIAEVELVKGKNTITVLFADKAGNSALITVNVTRAVDKPPEKGFIPGFTTAAAFAAAASAVAAAGAARRRKTR